jgi:hypothetical protein
MVLHRSIFHEPPVVSVAPAFVAVKRAAAGVAALVIMLTFMLACPGDAAADRYARSNSPYWKVGRLDPALTQACRKLQFNQRNVFSPYIGFTGERGRGSTGMGKKGWNLDDPFGLAREGFTYHFFNDGLSDCTVFVAGPAAGPHE